MTEDTMNDGLHVDDDADDGIKRRLASKFKAAAFGEIVSVLMRSTAHRSLTLAQIETLLMPAVLNKQYIVARAKPKDDPEAAGMPVGVVIWARVSEALYKRLSMELDTSLMLSPADWTSGDHLWIIDVVGAPATAAAMVDELKKSVFAGREAKVRGNKDGKIVVQTLYRASLN
ncbi:MAG: toxin-activating lysine-acyltransferase [Chitinophagales bacterium]|nr:toxin-activating lysine-acyltransferase [Hyphomicrobiales bacterium]